MTNQPRKSFASRGASVSLRPDEAAVSEIAASADVLNMKLKSCAMLVLLTLALAWSQQPSRRSKCIGSDEYHWSGTGRLQSATAVERESWRKRLFKTSLPGEAALWPHIQRLSGGKRSASRRPRNSIRQSAWDECPTSKPLGGVWLGLFGSRDGAHHRG